MPTAPVRVVLAERDLFVRRGLSSIIGEADGIAVAAAVGSVDELLVAVSSEEPDVVVAESQLPPSPVGAAGIIERLRAAHPDLGVVVRSHRIERAHVMAFFGEGSAGRGYLLKGRAADPDQLVTAIRAVSAGGSFIDPAVMDTLVVARGHPASAVERLSSREREVLAQVAQGRSNQAISVHLGVSVRAVEKHINALFTKLGLFDDPMIHRRVVAALVHLDQDDR